MSEQDPISGSSRDYGTIAALPSVGFGPALFNSSEIADNINSINSGLRSLEKMMKQIGGPNDSMQLRDKIHDTQQTINSTASATSRDIQRLGIRRGDKQEKLQVERLTEAFKSSLAIYSSLQKKLTEKMSSHMPRQAKVRNDPQALEQQAIADDEEASLLANQQAQARLIQFETSMMVDKEAYLNKIEADVLDINKIMQDLAEIALAQGQTIDNVASNVEAAGTSVDVGVDEVAKAAEHQRRYRRKMFILILIAAILIIIFVVWLVKQFR